MLISLVGKAYEPLYFVMNAVPTPLPTLHVTDHQEVLKRRNNMKRPFVLVAVIPIVVLGLATCPAAAKDLHRVLGGGVATFDSVARLSSYFAIDATVLDAGDARGDFATTIVDFAVED